MPLFRYTAVDAQGRFASGSIDAVDGAAAEARLAGQGLSEIEVSAAEQSSGGTGDAGPALNAQQSVELALAIAELTRAELPLAGGLRAMAADAPAGRLTEVLEGLAERLETGESLEEALRSLGRRLPAHLYGLLTAGLRSGRLAEAVGEYMQHRNTTNRLQRQVWASLLYPLLLVALLLGLLMFYETFLFQELVEIYREFGAAIPWPTRLVMAVAGAGSWLLLGIAASLAMVVLVLRSLYGPALLHRLLKAVPLVGPLWRWAALNELSRLLALLLDGRTPLPEALELTAEGVGDLNLAAACRGLGPLVAGGAALSEGIARNPAFPSTLCPLVRWGERRQALPEALRAAADVFARRADTQAVLIRAVLPPLLFLLVLTGALLLVTATYVPMIDMMQRLV